MHDKIIKALESQRKTGLSPKELRKAVGVRRSTSGQLERFEQALQELVAQSKVIDRSGKLASAARLGLVPGEIVKVNATFGFARPQDWDQDVFVPGRMLAGAMPGDGVLLKIARRSSGQLPEGEVVKVTAESQQRFSGVIELREDGPYVLPDRYIRFALRATVPKGLGKKIRNGDKVLAELVVRGNSHSRHKVKVLQSFGSPDSAKACSEAALAAAGIRRSFPPEVTEQAAAIGSGSGIHPKELASRTDLRDQLLLTIDGADSKDLDDAISLQPVPNGWELGVHIADVSYYVTHQTPIDKEALERGTSLYVADWVVPMLPVELSNGICSINPGEDRLALSAIINLDTAGKMTDFRFEKTVIRSHLKGVYQEVNALLGGEASQDIIQKYSTVAPMLHQMQQLAQLLSSNRFARGAVNLESVESRISLDETGKAVEVGPRVQGITEGIIEEFMLLANQAAATLLVEKQLPGIYRIHENPAPDKLQSLYQMLDKLGVAYPKTKKPGDPAVLSKILEQVDGSPLDPVVNSLVLRSMAKAKYSNENIGHYGLSLQNYLHFTAPIRRYPDLMVHRILSGLLTGMKEENIKKRFGAQVSSVAYQSTQRELETVAVSRQCEDCYKAEYMSSFVGQEFDGAVISATAFGIYVQLANTVEGMIRVADLPGEDWEYDGYVSFTSGVGNRKIQVGDKLRIRVAGVDIGAGLIDFVPVWE